jgi:hypothetical protein
MAQVRRHSFEHGIKTLHDDRLSASDGAQAVVDRRDTDGIGDDVSGCVIADGQHQITEVAKRHGDRVRKL